VPKRLPELPKRDTPRRGFDFSFLTDGQAWLLVRGVDFQPEAAIATVRRRIRDWAERQGYGRGRGYVLETRVVAKHPKRGQDYRELKGIPRRDKETRPEYGLAVRLVKDRERAQRRLRRFRAG
jgi:hypothetical protein